MSSASRKKPTKYLVAAILLIIVFIGGSVVKYLIEENYIDPYNEKVELKALRWPSSEIGQMLPKPDSLRGYTYWESSTGFDIDVGDYTPEMFNDYITACMNKGFTVDYHANPHSFSAYNSEGYDLYLYYYEDDKIMNVNITAPIEKPEENDSTLDT